MSISLDEIKHVARLARLEQSDEELEALRIELNALLQHFEDIKNVDVSGIEPKPHAVRVHNVWAEDVARESLSREQALANSHKSRAGLFVVPTIIED